MGVVMPAPHARWRLGYLIRRFGEAAALCTPLMAVLFIPSSRFAVDLP